MVRPGTLRLGSLNLQLPTDPWKARKEIELRPKEGIQVAN